MVFAKEGYTKGNRGLKLEEYKTGQIYSITINPLDQPHMPDEIDGYRRCVSMWLTRQHTEFYKFKDILKLVLFVEVSPLGRFHFHGTVSPLDIGKLPYFLNYLNNKTHFEIDKCGSCTCDDNEKTCHGFHHWYDYIKKQEDIWNVELKNNRFYPIEIDEDSEKYLIKPKAPPSTLTKWLKDDNEDC